MGIGYSNIPKESRMAGMTETITEWLPTIITFAMLGMVVGLLKKLGKW